MHQKLAKPREPLSHQVHDLHLHALGQTGVSPTSHGKRGIGSVAARAAVEQARAPLTPRGPSLSALRWKWVLELKACAWPGQSRSRSPEVAGTCPAAPRSRPCHLYSPRITLLSTQASAHAAECRGNASMAKLVEDLDKLGREPNLDKAKAGAPTVIAARCVLPCLR
jgi:hypothetical protein